MARQLSCIEVLTSWLFNNNTTIIATKELHKSLEFKVANALVLSVVFNSFCPVIPGNILNTFCASQCMVRPTYSESHFALIVASPTFITIILFTGDNWPFESMTIE